MPITEELKTAQELRAAGAAPALAELLAAKLEATAAAARDSAFRDFLAEMKSLRADIDVRFAQVDVRFAETRAQIVEMKAQNAETRAALETSMRVWMAAWIAALGVAVAIIKLFPNWH